MSDSFTKSGEQSLKNKVTELTRRLPYEGGLEDPEHDGNDL